MVNYPTIDLYIDGHWKRAGSQPMINPADESVLGDHRADWSKRRRPSIIKLGPAVSSRSPKPGRVDLRPHEFNSAGRLFSFMLR